LSLKHRYLALIAAPLCLVAGIASAECRDDWICVDEVRSGSDVELRARNLGNYPITYTLSVRTRNFSVAGPNTVTRTLGPGESERVMLLDHHEGGDKGYYRYSYDWTVGRIDANHDDDHLYALPYASNRSYRVLQGYGSSFSHRGIEEYAIDFDMREGTPVHAARSGVVARVEESHDRGCWSDGCGKFANYVVILHTDGTTGEYYHLKKAGALVKVGDSVARGQRIGLSGNTGHTTMPHLHFAVYRAVEWGRTQSIAVRFQSADGIIERPRRGGRYQAQ
jgi:murein DD-endopeptidase MepM/ murein hydrolase activator NlpD